MSSPSGSGRSERSLFYWGSDSGADSPSPSSGEGAGATSSTGRDLFPAPRPRLSSPRIFRDFFSSNISDRSGSREPARLPPAPTRTSAHDFPRAFENVNRAVQTAHQAFQNTAIVDLTDSPPPRNSLSPRPSGTLDPSASNAPFLHHRLVATHHPISSPRAEPPTPHRAHAMPSQTPSNSASRAPKRRRIALPTDGGVVLRSSPEGEAGDERELARERDQEVDAVDLTEVDNDQDLQEALSKQRQDAISAQMKEDRGGESSGRTALSSYKCPICMDTPENATTTICGHLFCHKCIIDTLRWSEEQRQDDFMQHGKVKGTCPVCRKPLARLDKSGVGRTLIPLELKLTATKRVDVKGKGVDRGAGVLSQRAPVSAKEERESSTDIWRNLIVL